MREAVIVWTTRTPIGKAYRGALSDISGPHLAAHALTGALDPAVVTGEEINDVVPGCAIQEGTTGYNVARQAALRAGLPATAMFLEASEASRRGLTFHSSASPVVSDARRCAGDPCAPDRSDLRPSANKRRGWRGRAERRLS